MKVSYAYYESGYTVSALYLDGELVRDDKGSIGRDFIFDEIIERGGQVDSYEEIEVWQISTDKTWPRFLEDLVTIEEMTKTVTERFTVDLETAFQMNKIAESRGLETGAEKGSVFVVSGPRWKMDEFVRRVESEYDLVAA